MSKLHGPFLLDEEKLVQALNSGTLSNHRSNVLPGEARKLARAMIEAAENVWQGRERYEGALYTGPADF